MSRLYYARGRIANDLGQAPLRESACDQAANAIAAETIKTAGHAPTANAKRCDTTNAPRPKPVSPKAVRAPWRCVHARMHQAPAIAITAPPSGREPLVTATRGTAATTCRAPRVRSDGRAPPGLYFSHPACLEHDPQAQMPGHPDTSERLLAIERTLAAEDWLGWERREAPLARESEIELIHDAAHLRRVKEMALAGGGALDADTFVGEPSFRAALHAAGGACEMTRALMGGEARLGFCEVRPPGHHAEAARAMGFCLFNNVAIAAALAISELAARRVFILDWDVHHGNGTAEAFRDRADVLYASIHQSGIYPGTGALDDPGSGTGEGYTINLPVPAGSEEELWLALIERIVLPAARAFGPELILISAGFDAHREDPLADCSLQDGTFAEMARHARDLAADLDAPLGVVLEGGYEPDALARSLRGALAALTDAQPARPGAAQVTDAVAQIGRYWEL
jgi:acetoin utilization deacetylase AcuC-like enzyme